MTSSKLFEHRSHRHEPRNVNDVHKDEQAAGGFNARLAVRITRAFGSMPAFYVLVAWMLVWMTLATARIGPFALDQFPFVFLLFLSNLVQLWALPVLAVGQNVLSRKAELQSEEDFRINQESFADIKQIMEHLGAQDEQILRLIKLVEGRQ